MQSTSMPEVRNTSTIELLRTPKIFDFVIFDWVATAATAYMAQQILNVDFIICFVVLIILSIILHILFNVDTTTNYLLGFSDKPVHF